MILWWQFLGIFGAITRDGGGLASPGHEGALGGAHAGDLALTDGPNEPVRQVFPNGVWRRLALSLWTSYGIQVMPPVTFL